MIADKLAVLGLPGVDRQSQPVKSRNSVDQKTCIVASAHFRDRVIGLVPVAGSEIDLTALPALLA